MPAPLQPLLQATDEACSHLAQARDREVLHRFRVALRKLDTLLRSSEPTQQGAAQRQLQQAIKRLFRLTNPLRDDDVALDWLAALPPFPSCPPAQRERTAELIDERRTRQLRMNQGAIVETWQACLALSQSPALLEFAPDNSALGAALDQHIQAFDQAYRKLDRRGPHLHKARIRTKRLRYFLSSFEARLGETEEIINQLKALQQILGHIHDRQQFADMFEAMGERGGDLTPCLEALRHKALEQESQLTRALFTNDAKQQRQALEARLRHIQVAPGAA